MKTQLKLVHINLRLLFRLIFTLGLAFMAGAADIQVAPVEAKPLESGLATLWTVTDTASLNTAITAANAETSGTHTITFGSNITLTAQTTAIDLQPGVTLIIEGAGNTLDGGGAYRGFNILGVSAIELRNLTITNGYDDYGGGILNGGTLTVTNSTFSGNRATATTGSGGGIFNQSTGTLSVTNSTFSGNSATNYTSGGIYNEGTLTVTNSTFSGNNAKYGGGIYNIGTLTVTNSTFFNNSSSTDAGGIANYGGSLSVTNSTFSENSTTGSGGGIANHSTLTVTNSTFSENSATASGFGGGIYNGAAGNLTVTNSTFSGNSATVSGGGIYNWGTLNMINAILSNSTAGVDCNNTGTMGGDLNNLIEDNSGCGTPVSTEDPILGPLQDNGGPTHTHALLPGSPAIDAGDNAACAASPVNGLDQRGWIRPIDADLDGTAVCDIGAFEAPPPYQIWLPLIMR